jgi:hypothetical protein
VLEKKRLAERLVLATRRVEFSRDEDLSCVMQDDADPNERSIDWEVKGARQLEQAFSCLANERDVAQETLRRTQSCKELVGVFNGSRIERHTLARPTYICAARAPQASRVLRTKSGQNRRGD